jgi:carboxylate-amine ligase
MLGSLRELAARIAGRDGTGAVPDVEEGPLWPDSPRLTVEQCRAAFDAVEPFTIGVEEELMLVSPATLDLEPANQLALDALDDPQTYRPELRASQLEIVTPVLRTAEDVYDALAHARRRLTDATRDRVRLLACGTHPFARDWGEVSADDRYRMIEDEYVWAARRSYVCGLHVHVAVGGADRSLAVYNALRSYLPEIVGLAGNSPFYEGEDTGLCSIRPKLNQALPRTGTPPAFSSWTEFVGLVDWGRRGGLFPDSTFFWWDLRPHPKHGTIELRAADSQTRIEDAAAVAALVQTLAAWLANQFDHGEHLPVHDRHRIEENAWRALRYGVRGHLVDLETGRREPFRDRVVRLLDDVSEAARRLGSQDALHGIRALLAGNGADRQRYVAERDGMKGLVGWLADATEEQRW